MSNIQPTVIEKKQRVTKTLRPPRKSQKHSKMDMMLATEDFDLMVNSLHSFELRINAFALLKEYEWVPRNISEIDLDQMMNLQKRLASEQTLLKLKTGIILPKELRVPPRQLIL